jgi:hypothetical protein
MNLGQVAAKIAKIREDEQFGYDDIQAHHAPLECCEMVGVEAEKRIDAVLREAGLTRAEWNDLLAERTGGRWVMAMYVSEREPR